MLVGPQGSLGHGVAGRRSMGRLGMAIRSLYQALEMGVLLLGILTGSKSCLLEPGPDAPAALLPKHGIGASKTIRLQNGQGCLDASYNPALEKAV